MRFVQLCLLVGLLLAISSGQAVSAAAPNSLILNEANSVSGGAFIDKGRGDTFDGRLEGLGRIEGHGQNWFEFLVVRGDERLDGSFSKTLDLRGWTLHWEYDKQDPLDPHRFGSGVIKFTNDPLWAAVPQGTLLTVSEWQEAWYVTDSPFEADPWGAGGMLRAGGTNGLGTPRGVPYDPDIHTHLDLSTNTTWNPHSNGDGSIGDWNLHVYAGERNLDDTFKYFEFSGSITNGDDTIAIGTDNGGLFAINNDNWQWTIKNAAGGVVQGPFGEIDTGLGSTWSVSSQEIIKLEAFAQGTGATQESYLGTAIADYRDGSTGSFGQSNSWSSGGFYQDLSSLRDWLVEGDINLDGHVDGRDFLAWQRGIGTGHGSLTQGDLNGDGNVDGRDLQVWQNVYGAGSSLASATAVPEPGAIFMGLCAATMILGLRKTTSGW